MLRARIQAQLARGVRANSSSSASSVAARATSAISSVTNTISETVASTIYWSKVTAEVAKQVYIKEGLSVPSGAEFSAVFAALRKQGQTFGQKFVEEPTVLLDLFKGVDRGQVIKYGAYTVQLLGLFSLGEIVGRRHVVDYPHH